MKRKNDFQKKPVFYGMFETEWGNCYVGGERKTIGRMTLIFRGPKEKAIERLRSGKYLLAVLIRFPDGNSLRVTAGPMTLREKQRFISWRHR